MRREPRNASVATLGDLASIHWSVEIFASLAVVLTMHARFRAATRWQGAGLTEGQIRQKLLHARYFPAPAGAWHAVVDVAGQDGVFVVAIDRELVTVITSYPLAEERRSAYRGQGRPLASVMLAAT